MGSLSANVRTPVTSPSRDDSVREGGRPTRKSSAPEPYLDGPLPAYLKQMGSIPRIDAISVSRELRIVAEFGQAEFLAKGLPLRIADDADEYHLVIRRREDVVDGPCRNAFRHRCRRCAGNRILRHVLADQERRTFKQ